jgi:hypothetical protein
VGARQQRLTRPNWPALLRGGRVVANLRKEEITIQDIVMWITGAALPRN